MYIIKTIENELQTWYLFIPTCISVYFLKTKPWKSHGEMSVSVAGYSPWGSQKSHHIPIKQQQQIITELLTKLGIYHWFKHCHLIYQCYSDCPGLSCPITAAAAAAKLLQPCPTLCNPIDGSPPGSSVPGILQARILEWVAISFSNARKWKVKVKVKVKVKSCLTLSDLMDWSLPGSSVHGIFQARVLEWGAIAFSACLISHPLMWYI